MTALLYETPLHRSADPIVDVAEDFEFSPESGDVVIVEKDDDSDELVEDESDDDELLPATPEVNGSASAGGRGKSTRYGDGSDPSFDDPIRMYLEQIGKIPLLTRKQEIALAKRVEDSRRKFRRGLLECDFVLQQAMELLRSVDDEELSFDRTVQVSPIDRLEKRHILGRLPFNLSTLDALVQRNRRDFKTLEKSELPRIKRRAAWMRLVHRRRRAVRLIEELGLRIEFLEDLWPPLKEIGRRAEDLRARIDRLKKRNGPRKRSLWKSEAEELNRIMEYVGQSPRGLRNRVRRLRSVYQEYQQAKRQLSEGNLRLVVSIAKNYRHRGVGFLDLIQEGNAGLMRAVEKFEYRRGFKFSTYATWWIRQAVSRAVSDQSRTVRVPAHMFSTMSFIQKVFRRLQHELGRAPTVEEVAKAAKTTPDEARAVLGMNRVPMSLDRPVGDTDDTNFGDLLSGSEFPDPAAGALREMLRGEIDEILEALGYREREIIKLRYGLGDGYNYTLEEVATIFRVTRERIRQIEARAFQKIQQSANVKRLAGFLD